MFEDRRNPGRATIGRQTVEGYRLLAGSPAIGSGKAIADNGGKDLFGAKVPSCVGIDRGAEPRFARAHAPPTLKVHLRKRLLI